MSSEPWPYYMCAIFAQLLDYPPACELQKCVDRYDGDGRLRGFSCLEQYLAISCAQLTYRESLRDIEACLGSVNGKLCHIGFRRRVARTNLADADEAHDWRIFVGFAQVLVGITDGTTSDVAMLDEILPEAGSFYVMDCGILRCTHGGEYPAATALLALSGPEHRPVLWSTRLLGRPSSRPWFTRIHCTASLMSTWKRFRILGNNFALPALAIARIYKSCRQVELFFKWIKQHLRIKAFYGTSETR